MKLMNINNSNIKRMLAQHRAEDGRKIEDSIRKLFNLLHQENNIHEVSIKVAALNQIYSTAITYTKPVVENIFRKINNSHSSNDTDQYVELVDSISTVTWVSPSTSKTYTRRNLSFSSKYIYFISNRKIPIYDSYIWIIIIGYLNQNRDQNYKFRQPKSYREFYQIFQEFQTVFRLKKYSFHNLDKFLWQYGNNLIKGIMDEDDYKLDKAKSILKKRIMEF